MHLAKIIAGLDPAPRAVDGPADVDIASITHDSRLAGAGSLFFALPSVSPGRAGADELEVFAGVVDVGLRPADLGVERL